MMDFSTHFCRKFKLWWLLLISCVAFAAPPEGIHVKDAELVPVEDAYQLAADFEIVFSPEVEAALNKGVPLTFLLEFQLVSPRKYWFDDEIVTTSRRVILSYHALSRQYLINVNKHQKSFATLGEAVDELSHVRDWVVLEKAQIPKPEDYQAVLRFRLDPAKLPKALQVEVLGSEKWTLVSERYRWSPEF